MGFKDITGQRFHNLLVVDVAGTKNGGVTWNCICDCGSRVVKCGKQMRYGSTKRCGHKCPFRIGNRTHGHSPAGNHSPEYRAWKGMQARCHNKNNPRFKDYGGRGIVVCQRWRDAFENFLADMGERPTPTHSIDRINNDGNYEPGNCRWATRTEQNRNRRSIIPITFYGKTLSLTEWSNISQVHWSAIYGRLRRGWSEKEAVWTPAGTTKRRMSR